MHARRTCIAFLALVLLGLPAAVTAQAPIPNPTKVEYIPSADHSVVLRYELGYFRNVTQPDPTFMFDLGKPACAPVCLNDLPPKPGFGNLIARVRAIGADLAGGEIASPWSEDSNPFVLLPVAPGRPTIKP